VDSRTSDPDRDIGGAGRCNDVPATTEDAEFSTCCG